MAMLNAKTDQLYKTIIFKGENVFLSLHALFFILGIIIFIYFGMRKKTESNVRTLWRNYFLIFFVVCSLILFSSHWVYLNYTPNRYFIVLYVEIWIVALISIEHCENKKRLILQSIFLTSVLFSSLSSIAPYYLDQETSEVKRLNDFKKLGRIGVIGNYWRSYNIAAVDPVNINSTPNVKELIRCKTSIDSVFACSTIYLVQDGWLDSLPKKIKQFGVELYRMKQPCIIGGFTVAPYSLTDWNKRLSGKDLKTNFAEMISDNESFSKRVYFTDQINVASSSPNYFIYGPYISIKKASYTVRFALKSTKLSSNDNVFAKVDVAYDHGEKEIVSRDIKRPDFKLPGQYNIFELKINTDKILKDVEFRVIYGGKENLWFDYVEISQENLK